MAILAGPTAQPEPSSARITSFRSPQQGRLTGCESPVQVGGRQEAYRQECMYSSTIAYLRSTPLRKMSATAGAASRSENDRGL